MSQYVRDTVIPSFFFFQQRIVTFPNFLGGRHAFYQRLPVLAQTMRKVAKPIFQGNLATKCVNFTLFA
jgi:hypothetical protein